MSEIIEVVTASAVAGAGEAEVAPAAHVAAADLVRLTQGLYFIFWGLLVIVVVSVQAVVLLWMRAFAETFFLGGGVLATVVGSWRLHQARLADLPDTAASGRWRKRVSRLRALALLLAYFAVLFYLWRRLPGNLYLQLNAAAFVAACIAYLTMLNRTVTTLAALVGRQQMALEARLFTAANIVLLLLPFVVALGYIVLRAVTQESSLLDEFRKLLERVSLLGAIVVLLPVSLTLALVWAAKDTLVQELVSRGGRSAREPATP